MSRQYPLARLLRLRKMREDEAANELALAQRRELQARQKTQRAQEELVGSSFNGDYDESLWRSSIAAQAARRSMLLEAMTLAEVAAHETTEAHSQWTAARKESRPLEKLEEKFQEAANAEELRAEAIVLDEIAQNIKRQDIGDSHVD